MLGIAATAQFLSGPGQSYSVAAFKGPMETSLGLSDTDYSLAYGVATVASGLSLPFFGRMVDRLGARRLLPFVALSLSAACLFMATVRDLGSLYVSFAMVRCLGQGALTLLATWLINEWFQRRRGFATALAGIGSSLSVVAFPVGNSWLIGTLGWPAAWVVLGIVVAVTLVIPTHLLVRDRPEELGLQPDGDAPQPEEQSTTVDLEDSWSVTEALRDVTFWKLLAVGASSGMVGTGMIFHQVGLLGSRGVSPEIALGLISFQAVVATIAALGVGWLTDRLPNQRLLGIAMLLLATSVALVWHMSTPALAFVYAALMGLHGSILRSAGMVVWVNFYGRRNQGAIRGIVFSAMILAAAVGPLPLAIARDHWGTYTPALFTFVVIPLVSGALALSARPPQRRTALVSSAEHPS